MDAWKSDLETKDRKKLAASVASPEEDPELFSEGWPDVLEREKVVVARRNGIKANGHSGEHQTLIDSCANRRLTSLKNPHHLLLQMRLLRIRSFCRDFAFNYIFSV